MLPRTGREKNVFFKKATEICSLRFHGKSDTQRAIAQYPNISCAHVPTVGTNTQFVAVLGAQQEEEPNTKI
jgi:hypothetical protein